MPPITVEGRGLYQCFGCDVAKTKLVRSWSYCTIGGPTARASAAKRSAGRVAGGHCCPPSPLRTALATFTARGSSRSNAPFTGRAAPEFSPMQLHDMCRRPHPCRRSRRLTQARASSPLGCSLVYEFLFRCHHQLSRDERPGGSLHPFGLGISTSRWPYPPHYRAAFAFSTFLYPLPYQRPLRFAFPMGGQRAYHVPLVYLRGLGPSSTHRGHSVCDR